MKTNGWEIAGNGSAILEEDPDGLNFIYYIYRKDKNNWGDCFLKPHKYGTFRVTLDFCFNNVISKERVIVETFAKGKELQQKYLVKYPCDDVTSEGKELLDASINASTPVAVDKATGDNIITLGVEKIDKIKKILEGND